MLLLLLALLADPDIQVKIIDNKNYVCFDEDSSRDLLELRLNYESLTSKDGLQEKQIALKTLQLEKWTRAYEGMLDQNAMLIEELQKTKDTMDASQRWYNSPVFWGVVGFAVGVVSSVGAYYGLSHK